MDKKALDKTKNCEKVKSDDIKKSLIEARRLLVEVPKNFKKLTLLVSSDVPIDSSAHLIVKSNKADGVMYFGHYQEEVAILFDPKLASDKGGDNLFFYVVDERQSVSCLWANEENYNYWTPNARIRIHFYKQGHFEGTHGLFRQHDVEFIK